MERICAVALTCLACLAAPAVAETPSAASPVNSQGTSVLDAGTSPAESAFIARLAGDYGVQKEEIQTLRNWGLDWGEIGRGLAVSRRAGRGLSEVMTLRSSGAGWEDIARSFGFRSGDVDADVLAVNQRARDMQLEAQGGAGAPLPGASGAAAPTPSPGAALGAATPPTVPATGSQASPSRTAPRGTGPMDTMTGPGTPTPGATPSDAGNGGSNPASPTTNGSASGRDGGTPPTDPNPGNFQR
jgi:hypothetical protein